MATEPLQLRGMKRDREEAGNEAKASLSDGDALPGKTAEFKVTTQMMYPGGVTNPSFLMMYRQSFPKTMSVQEAWDAFRL